MICYKLTIAYEGTNYSGWQFQVNAPSIQEELQKESLVRQLVKLKNVMHKNIIVNQAEHLNKMRCY